MSTLGTLAELEAQPVGASIMISAPGSTQRTTWIRTEAGWTNQSAVLESDMLAGYAEAGLIQDATQVDPVPREWYQSRYHWLWVVSTDAEHRMANCLLFHRQSAVIEDHNLLFSRFHGTRYRRLEELPADLITRPYVQALIQRLVTEREQCQVATTQAREFKRRPDPEQVRAETVVIQQALARMIALLPNPPEADPF